MAQQDPGIQAFLQTTLINGKDTPPVVTQLHALSIHRCFLRYHRENHLPTGRELAVAVLDELCASSGIQEIDEPVAKDAVVVPAVVGHICHRAVVNGDLQTKL